MSDSPSLIMIQFLSWVADRPRTYAQTMEAWRTTCPRPSVWEDSVIEDLVRIDGGHRAVTLTPRGRAVLRKSQAGKGPRRRLQEETRAFTAGGRPSSAGLSRPSRSIVHVNTSPPGCGGISNVLSTNPIMP